MKKLIITEEERSKILNMYEPKKLLKESMITKGDVIILKKENSDELMFIMTIFESYANGFNWDKEKDPPRIVTAGVVVDPAYLASSTLERYGLSKESFKINKKELNKRMALRFECSTKSSIKVRSLPSEINSEDQMRLYEYNDPNAFDDAKKYSFVYGADLFSKSCDSSQNRFDLPAFKAPSPKKLETIYMRNSIKKNYNIEVNIGTIDFILSVDKMKITKNKDGQCVIKTIGVTKYTGMPHIRQEEAKVSNTRFIFQYNCDDKNIKRDIEVREIVDKNINYENINLKNINDFDDIFEITGNIDKISEYCTFCDYPDDLEYIPN